MSPSFSTIFRRARIVIFILTAISSIFLTVMYSMLLAKDFVRYTALQRGDVVGLAVVNGSTVLAMYLMLTTRYPAKIDAVLVSIIFALQTAGTTIFTLELPSIPCTAFGGGGDMCKRLSFATSIVSWGLCGLLLLFGASLAALACIPRPEAAPLKPFTIAPSLSNIAASRHSPTASIDSQTRLIDVEKQASAYPGPIRAPPPARMQNPFSVLVDRDDQAGPIPYRQPTSAPQPRMAPQPMATPQPMGPPRPVRPATRPTVVLPPRVALAQRTPNARLAAMRNPRRAATDPAPGGVAPAPPHLTDPVERARVVKAGGGMEWRKLVLDAAGPGKAAYL